MSVLVCCCAFGLLHRPFPAVPEANPVEIVRQSVEKDNLNFRRGREYTYQQLVVTHQLDSHGKVKKTESLLYDVVTISDEPYSKLIERDGKQLPEKERRKVEKKLEQQSRRGRNESPQARAERQEKRHKQEEEGRRFLLEIPRAFEFTLRGAEHVDGHEAWVIDAEPRPEYRSKVKDSELLRKFRGRLWIDKAEYQWVRVDAETIDTVSIGLLLARLGKGARMTFEQKRMNSEVWLPSRATFRVDGRLALLKSFRISNEVTWSRYRKFTADSRIVSVEEVPEPDRK